MENLKLKTTSLLWNIPDVSLYEKTTKAKRQKTKRVLPWYYWWPEILNDLVNWFLVPLSFFYGWVYILWVVFTDTPYFTHSVWVCVNIYSTLKMFTYTPYYTHPIIHTRFECVWIYIAHSRCLLTHPVIPTWFESVNIYNTLGLSVCVCMYNRVCELVFIYFLLLFDFLNKLSSHSSPMAMPHLNFFNQRYSIVYSWNCFVTFYFFCY